MIQISPSFLLRKLFYYLRRFNIVWGLLNWEGWKNIATTYAQIYRFMDNSLLHNKKQNKLLYKLENCDNVSANYYSTRPDLKV